MAEHFTVHFTTEASFSVVVDAEDPDDAMDKAWDSLQSPSSLVYAGHPLGFDLAGEWEPVAVVNATGRDVWPEQS